MGPPRKLAVCDADAFYPFRSLIEGKLSDPEEIPGIERFLRGVVLHDEIAMDLQPWGAGPDDEEGGWTEEEIQAGGRPVIVAVGPVTDHYDLFWDDYRSQVAPIVSLSPKLIALAEEFSNATEGNVYYKAHIDYLCRLFGVVGQGGSVICDGSFGKEAFEKTTEFPTELFKNLDEDWQQYGQALQAGNLGIKIPPLLAIVLNRCARRDAILPVVKDLRDEWATPRNKVWELMENLNNAQTLKESNDIQRELAEASKHFSPVVGAQSYSPMRMLWEFSGAALEGAATAAVAGGDAKLGALSKLLAQAARFLWPHSDQMRRLFSRGAFDLARRMSREAASVAPVPNLLSRFLTDSEKQALGY